MKCVKCGCTDKPLFRQNEKGVPGVWACEPCSTQPIDPEVAELVAIIEADKETKQ